MGISSSLSTDIVGVPVPIRLIVSLPTFVLICSIVVFCPSASGLNLTVAVWIAFGLTVILVELPTIVKSNALVPVVVILEISKLALPVLPITTIKYLD